MIAIQAEALRDLVARIFAAAGCDAAESARIGRYLVSANLAGHDSHGVIRVPRYVEWLHGGYVHAGVHLAIVTEGPTHAVVDGGYGFGQTIAPEAVDLGIAKAQAAGMAVIALRNSGHIGRVGDWGERAAEAGLVSLHFVNVGGGEIVAPFGGVQRRFGTNPVCICVPCPPGPPLLLDFATSLVAEGKVLVASNGGKPVPHGSLIGPDGALSADPALLYGDISASAARNPARGAGALRAFGEHKGSGLAFMCEILAGCLTGSPTARPLSGDGKRGQIANGMLSFYLAPDRFGGEAMRESAREYAAYVKASLPAAAGGEVLVPGEAETRTRAARLRDGIPLQADTWAAIRATAERLGVAVAVGG